MIYLEVGCTYVTSKVCLNIKRGDTTYTSSNRAWNDQWSCIAASLHYYNDCERSNEFVRCHNLLDNMKKQCKKK